MNFAKGLFGLLLLLCLVILLGCGKKSLTPASVSGTVSYKGKPVKAGQISFYPKEGGLYPTSLKDDGTYSIIGVPSGEMTVAIETESANPNKPTYGRGQGGKGGGAVGPRPDYAPPEAPKGDYLKIPPKYADPQTSGLKVTLINGQNVQNFELTD